MTLDPYKPIPWESFTLVEPTPIKRKRSPHAFLILAAIAVVTGVMWAAAQMVP